MHSNTFLPRACLPVLVGATLLLCGCDREKPVPAEFPEAIATTRQVMLGITKPTSDVVFQVGAKEPASAAEWELVEANAQALAESGLLLTRGLRAVNQPEWRQFVKDLIGRAHEAETAAREKNVEATLNAGNQIYEVCDNCHKKYLPQPPNETPGAGAGATSP